MTRQVSNKSGLRSDTLKKEASRHVGGPMPATTPVPGAFGKQRRRTRAERSRTPGAAKAARPRRAAEEP
jgi:hypothetical protein